MGDLPEQISKFFGGGGEHTLGKNPPFSRGQPPTPTPPDPDKAWSDEPPPGAVVPPSPGVETPAEAAPQPKQIKTFTDLQERNRRAAYDVYKRTMGL